MNPETATIGADDLVCLLHVDRRSVWRWLAPEHPPYILRRRTYTYSLVDIVVRLVARRRGGLTPSEMKRLSDHDSAVRAEIGGDGLWLGNFPEPRAKDFLESLRPEPKERARAIQKQVRRACVSAGLTAVERTAQISVLFPDAVVFILSGVDSVLPVNPRAWESLARGLWAVNPQTKNMKEVA